MNKNQMMLVDKEQVHYNKISINYQSNSLFHKKNY